MTKRSMTKLARLIVRFHDNEPETLWTQAERNCFVMGAMHAWDILAEHTTPMTISNIREWAKQTKTERLSNP